MNAIEVSLRTEESLKSQPERSFWLKLYDTTHFTMFQTYSLRYRIGAI